MDLVKTKGDGDVSPIILEQRAVKQSFYCGKKTGKEITSNEIVMEILINKLKK